MENLTTLALLVGAVMSALLVIGAAMARLYKPASKAEKSRICLTIRFRSDPVAQEGDRRWKT